MFFFSIKTHFQKEDFELVIERDDDKPSKIYKVLYIGGYKLIIFLQDEVRMYNITLGFDGTIDNVEQDKSKTQHLNMEDPSF